MSSRPVRQWLFLAALVGSAGASTECWRPEPAPGTVTFVATQAGAPFEGSFDRFEGRICLDPAHPEEGRIEVSVDTASVNTGLPEFDDALMGAEFFDSAHWPQATFASDSIESGGDNQFKVRGRFTLRDVTRDIEVPFALEQQGDGALIKGEARINRLDYNVGLGEWRDTRWVGDPVILKFAVKLSR